MLVVPGAHHNAGCGQSRQGLLGTGLLLFLLLGEKLALFAQLFPARQALYPLFLLLLLREPLGLLCGGDGLFLLLAGSFLRAANLLLQLALLLQALGQRRRLFVFVFGISGSFLLCLLFLAQTSLRGLAELLAAIAIAAIAAIATLTGLVATSGGSLLCCLLLLLLLLALELGLVSWRRGEVSDGWPTAGSHKGATAYCTRKPQRQNKKYFKK